MKRVLLAAALFTLALSGCDTIRGWFGMGTNDKPAVTLVNGQISVDPDPLTFTRDQRNVTIIWRLEDATLRFVPDSGIRIEGEVIPGKPLDRGQTEIVDCRVVADGKQFMCLNKNSRRGTYKYTVRIRTGSGTIIERDPSIFNDQ